MLTTSINEVESVRTTSTKGSFDINSISELQKKVKTLSTRKIVESVFLLLWKPIPLEKRRFGQANAESCSGICSMCITYIVLIGREYVSPSKILNGTGEQHR